jgi:hypothetical protein
MPYRGAQETASVRASLQHALDNYKPGDIKLSPSDITQSDTSTFGESHADELEKIASQQHEQPGLPITPPAGVVPLPAKDQAQVTSAPPPVQAPAASPSPFAGATTATPSETTQTAAVASSNAPVSSGSVLAPAGAPPVKYETAEDEKKRLESEQVDRISQGLGGASTTQDGELPPYQEL